MTTKRKPRPPGATVRAGYGAAHKKLRAAYKRDVVDKGVGYCWRCGRWLDPALPWQLGHHDTDRSRYMGPECVKCNCATAGRRPSTTRRWAL
jgi:hypothetical protein